MKTGESKQLVNSIQYGRQQFTAYLQRQVGKLRKTRRKKEKKSGKGEKQNTVDAPDFGPIVHFDVNLKILKI